MPPLNLELVKADLQRRIAALDRRAPTARARATSRPISTRSARWRTARG